MEAHGNPIAEKVIGLASRLPKKLSRLAIENVGIDRLDALYTAFDCVRRGGTVSISGVYGGTADPMPMMDLFDKGLTLRMGQCHVKRWTEELLDLAQQDGDVLGLESLATHRVQPRRGAGDVRPLPEEAGRRHEGGPQALRLGRFERARRPEETADAQHTEDPQHRVREAARPRHAAGHRQVVAGGELPVGGPDLPDGQPAAARAAAARAREAAAARPLGDDARAELRLRPPQPGDHAARPGDDLHHRAGPRRAGTGRLGVPRGDLLGGLPRGRPGPRRARPAVHAVLLPRRHPEPRRPGDARVDPRGWRARLRAVARLRRRLRQPRPRRRGRRRRRGGGDRPAGDELALQQVPRPPAGRCGAADPPPQRLQDRQPDGARPHPGGGAPRPPPRLRPHAVRRRGLRPRLDAPGVRGDRRPLPRRDQVDPAGGADRHASSRSRDGRGR